MYTCNFNMFILLLSISSTQSLNRVQLFATPWTTAQQGSLSITNSRSPPKPMSIVSVMPSAISSSVVLFSSCPQSLPASKSFPMSARRGTAKILEFQLYISPSNEHPGLISFRMDWLDLLAVQSDSQESSPTPQFKSISSSALSFLHSPTLTSIHNHWKNHSLD